MTLVPGSHAYDLSLAHAALSEVAPASCIGHGESLSEIPKWSLVAGQRGLDENLARAQNILESYFDAVRNIEPYSRFAEIDQATLARPISADIVPVDQILALARTIRGIHFLTDKGVFPDDLQPILLGWAKKVGALIQIHPLPGCDALSGHQLETDPVWARTVSTFGYHDEKKWDVLYAGTGQLLLNPQALAHVLESDPYQHLKIPRLAPSEQKISEARHELESHEWSVAKRQLGFSTAVVAALAAPAIDFISIIPSLGANGQFALRGGIVAAGIATAGMILMSALNIKHDAAKIRAANWIRPKDS